MRSMLLILSGSTELSVTFNPKSSSQQPGFQQGAPIAERHRKDMARSLDQQDSGGICINNALGQLRNCSFKERQPASRTILGRFDIKIANMGFFLPDRMMRESVYPERVLPLLRFQ